MLAKYWKIIVAFLVVIVLAGISIRYLYNENKDLVTEIADLKIANQICNSDYEVLQSKMEVIKGDLLALEKEKKELEEKVNRSKTIIRTINNDREILLNKVAMLKIPDGCEDIFQWMVKRFEERLEE